MESDGLRWTWANSGEVRQKKNYNFQIWRTLPQYATVLYDPPLSGGHRHNPIEFRRMVDSCQTVVDLNCPLESVKVEKLKNFIVFGLGKSSPTILMKLADVMYHYYKNC